MSTTPPAGKRLIELQQLLLAFQQVERRTVNPHDVNRRENDVEHSYHLAMAAWMLAPHFNLDRDKAIRLALAHDLVEIYAGDTFVFGDETDIASKEQREDDALTRLRREWPDFAEITDNAAEYKHKGSEEAKFVYVLDKLMPVILNILTEGVVWRQHKVTIERFIAEKERKIPKDSPLYPYYQELLSMLRQTPHYFYQEKADG